MEFTGTIDKVYHMLDRESKTMSVRVKLRNEKYMLKPGMFTNVYVQSAVKGESMPCVNAHAVIFEDGKEYLSMSRRRDICKCVRSRCISKPRSSVTCDPA